MIRASALTVSLGMLAACPAPRGPSTGAVAPLAIEIGRPGWTLSGVAGDGALVFTAMTSAAPGADPAGAPGPAAAGAAGAPGPRVAIEARTPGASAPVWRTELDGSGGPLVRTGDLVVAVLGGTGRVAGLALRGEPGGAIAALDAATGKVAWQLAIDATDWSVIAAIAATPDGVIVGGSFTGTLRIGATLVSSGGKADGFVARILTTGTAAPGTGTAASVAWLVRVGGPGSDAVQGVAASPGGDSIAIAGTFAPGADLLGQPLASAEDRSPAADGFVAQLDAGGARRWAQTFGGPADEAVAGVAIDARGRVAVAATVRDTLQVHGVELVASGPADGLVAWWTAGGEPGAQVLLGGPGLDGLRAITAAGDQVVVAGFYAGALPLGDRTLTAAGGAGGNDAFLAALDGTAGAVRAAWPISGDGREEITALAAIPGGFVAGVAHTAAAAVDGQPLPAPRDPMSGAAIVVRPLR